MAAALLILRREERDFLERLFLERRREAALDFLERRREAALDFLERRALLELRETDLRLRRAGLRDLLLREADLRLRRREADLLLREADLLLRDADLRLRRREADLRLLREADFRDLERDLRFILRIIARCFRLFS